MIFIRLGGSQGETVVELSQVILRRTPRDRWAIVQASSEIYDLSEEEYFKIQGLMAPVGISPEMVQ